MGIKQVLMTSSLLSIIYIFIAIACFLYHQNIQIWSYFDDVTLNDIHVRMNGSDVTAEIRGANQKFMSDNMTIVSAYFDIGSFRKGKTGGIHTPKLYQQWSKAFGFITNPVVIFTDSRKLACYIEKLRSKNGLSSKTKIIFTNRTSVWAFQLMKPLKILFSQHWYPKFHPNTVNPAYSCVQHSKYAVVADAVRRGYFNTPFYAWVDIGYFRDLRKKDNLFILNVPPKMDKNRIAFNKINNFNVAATYKAIFLTQMIWVGGGMFVGTPKLLLKLETEYKRAVMHFLTDVHLMNTDQQVLYAMFTRRGLGEIKPSIRLQTYIYDHVGKWNSWFHLGYLCRQVLQNITHWKHNVTV